MATEHERLPENLMHVECQFSKRKGPSVKSNFFEIRITVEKGWMGEAGIQIEKMRFMKKMTTSVRTVTVWSYIVISLHRHAPRQ